MSTKVDLGRTPQQRLTVGTMFESDDSRPWHEGPVKGVHSYTLRCRVTGTTVAGFEYEVLDVVAEDGRPTFGRTPTAGSIAWFVVPLYEARGTLRVVEEV